MYSCQACRDVFPTFIDLSKDNEITKIFDFVICKVGVKPSTKQLITVPDEFEFVKNAPWFVIKYPNGEIADLGSFDDRSYNAMKSHVLSDYDQYLQSQSE